MVKLLGGSLEVPPPRSTEQLPLEGANPKENRAETWKETKSQRATKSLDLAIPEAMEFFG